MAAGWRDLPEPQMQDFLNFVQGTMAERQEAGQKKHGKLFQGDPWQHAWEEWLDLGFYLWMERRKWAETTPGSTGSS